MMNQSIYFCLALHNHQPVGNFDHVFEQAYQDSYLPFLDVFEGFEPLRISLHTSGPLLEWLDQQHPDYLDRLAALVSAGRVEVVGGAFYEPILTMIPSRDRIGQIQSFTRWLESRLGATVRGMWMPERVWEPHLVSDLAEAQIEYTLLDDFHFQNAGWDKEDLNGYFVTEDSGKIVRVFPGSERLRYLVPFADPQETIQYLRESAEKQPNCIRVFGDDGEKFGTWPETKAHVYDRGWLRQFFELLVENQSWIRTTTLAEAVQAVPPAGKVFLPDSSYREMTEWALPVERQREYERLTHDLADDPRWPALRRFIRGGSWRNFKVKYPETDEMYARMMMVSQRLDDVRRRGAASELLDAAQRELYRGQCNCSYWHGAFGGCYLPHLRNAVYNHLIAADNLLDEVDSESARQLDGVAADFNFDARPEIQLRNEKLVCLLAPARGGRLYELDVRSICHNLAASLTRRPEGYHAKVLNGQSGTDESCTSIHDRVVFKQDGLEEKVQYDTYPRQSLLDHFFADDAQLDQVASGHAEERSDFVNGPYEARLRRSDDRIQAQMIREGQVGSHQLRLTKGVTLFAAQSELEIGYMLEGLPSDETLHFGIEFNLAGLPAGAEDRYFSQGDQQLGQLGMMLSLEDQHQLALTDEWLGMTVGFELSQPTHFWTFPLETVSQSEGGFELVHQSVVVLPHWHIRGDANGRWSVTMRLKVDTQLAESRMQAAAAAECYSSSLHR